MVITSTQIRFFQASSLIGATSLLLLIALSFAPRAANAACMPGGPCISVAPYTAHGMGGMGGMSGVAGSIMGSIISEAISGSISSSSSGSAGPGTPLNNESVKLCDQGVALANAGKPGSAIPFYQRAIRGFQQAAKADPSNATIRKNLATCRSNLAGAQQRVTFQKCNSFNDEGLKLANAGNNASAAELFGRALQLCPNVQVIKNNLDTVQLREEQAAAAIRADQQRQANLAQSAANTDRAINDLTASLNDTKPATNTPDLMGVQPRPGTQFFGQPSNPTNPNLNDSNVVDLRDAKTDVVNPAIVRGDPVGGGSANSQPPSTQGTAPENSAPSNASPSTSASTAQSNAVPSSPQAAAKTGSYAVVTPNAPAQSSANDIFNPNNLYASAGVGDYESPTPSQNQNSTSNQKCLGGTPVFNGKCEPAPNLKPSDETPVENPNAGAQVSSASKEGVKAVGEQGSDAAKRVSGRQFDTPPIEKGDSLGAVRIGPSEDQITYIRKRIFPAYDDEGRWQKLIRSPQGRALIDQAKSLLEAETQAKAAWEIAIKDNSPNMQSAYDKVQQIGGQISDLQEQADQVIIQLDDKSAATDAATPPANLNTSGTPSQ